MNPLALWRLYRMVKPILPVLLALLQENDALLRGLLKRTDTGPAEDARDFFNKARWQPFKKEWEE